MTRQPVTAADIVWTWPPTPPEPDAVPLALVLLGEVEEPLVLDAVQTLAVALTEQRERLQATRQACRVLLDLLGDAQREVGRLRRRLVDILDQGRRGTP